ncbi:uncharacterized protein EV420DRAFT_1242221, partial [Desarmillaria tabescens]
LGALPLVIGMPVMIMQNFDVEGGIVNGATRILEKVRYHLDDDGRHIVLSCIIKIPSMTGEPLSGLQESQAVALQDTVNLQFRH